MIRQTLTFIIVLFFVQICAQTKIKCDTYNFTWYSCGFSANIWQKYRLTLKNDNTFDYELLTYRSPVKAKKGYKKPALENYKSSFGKWTMKNDTLLLKPAFDDDLFDNDLIFTNNRLYFVGRNKKMPFRRELFPKIKIKRREWQRSDNLSRRVIET